MDMLSVLVFKEVLNEKGVSIDNPMFTPDSLHIVEESSSKYVPFEWEGESFVWHYVPPDLVLTFNNAVVLIGNPYSVVVSDEVLPFYNKSLNEVLKSFNLIEK